MRHENPGLDKIVGNDFELRQQAAMRREPWMVKRSPSVGTTMTKYLVDKFKAFGNGLGLPHSKVGVVE